MVLEINEGVGSSRHERCGRVLVERQKVGEKVWKNLSKKYSTGVNNSGPHLTKLYAEQIIRMDGGFIRLVKV